MNNIKKQYGLWTGIAMVVGIVIGSGVFLKAGGVLKLSGGDLRISLLAWFIGGIIMIASGFCFAIFATKITKYKPRQSLGSLFCLLWINYKWCVFVGDILKGLKFVDWLAKRNILQVLAWYFAVRVVLFV